jgi:hypothetical protein
VGPRAEIDELYFVRLVQQIDENVFVFDVSMDDPALVACQNCVDNLPKKCSRHFLFKRSLLRDEIKEVLAYERPLHDQDVGVRTFVEVQ